MGSRSLTQERPSSSVICAVCGEQVEAKCVQMHNEFRLYHCPACDVFFCNPMRNPGADWYKEFQTVYRVGGPGRSFALTWDHHQFFADRIAQRGRLLDIGCGSGHFIAKAQRLGYRVTGVDFDSNAINIGQNRLGLKNLFCGTLEDFVKSHPNIEFDIITCFGTFEHLDNPSEFLDVVRSILKAGGYLALTIPNRERWPNFKEWWDLPPFHLAKWSEKAIQNILMKKGFRIIKIKKGRLPWNDLLDYVRDRIHNRGIVTRILREAQSIADEKARQRMLRRATLIARIGQISYNILRVPISAGLFLVGATGNTLYVLANKSLESNEQP